MMHPIGWFSNNETSDAWHRHIEGTYDYWQEEARKARRPEKLAKKLSNDLKQYEGLACRSLTQKLEECYGARIITAKVCWHEIAYRLLQSITPEME
ncbi:MAG: hypothetical protein KGS09_18930 [Nitrospirae bacterium]|nr:hypothetical protein [Nitrospirota bacterium]MDE3219802.1 hypothetical protein [Nitrospirota bacterium]